MSKLIGFIGHGWIGKNYADDFERRGFDVVRYGLEEPHINNKERIRDCDIVFIAVPTPTLPDKGFDDSVLREVISLLGSGKIGVIKSTVLPGTTVSIQKENPHVILLHSPEFLVKKTAAFDAANPKRNIIGLPKDTAAHQEAAAKVLEILPRAPYETVCSSHEAELIKYGNNTFLYFKVIFMNLIYELAQSTGSDWDKVRDGIAADPRIGASHTEALHDGGRGVAGHCLTKDLAALSDIYKRVVGCEFGSKIFDSIADKNINLLLESKKGIRELEEIYGKEKMKNILASCKNKLLELEEEVGIIEEILKKEEGVCCSASMNDTGDDKTHF